MTSNITERYVSLERAMDRELSKHPVMLQLERQTGMKKTSIVFTTAGCTLTLILLKYMTEITLAMIMFVYPAIMTISAIESHDKKMDTHCLTYWLVLGALSVLETITGGLPMRTIPLYPIIKSILCIWLFLPSTRGATIVYERSIRPVALIIRDHPQVKELVKKVNKTTNEVAQEAKAAVNNTTASSVPDRKSTPKFADLAKED